MLPSTLHKLQQLRNVGRPPFSVRWADAFQDGGPAIHRIHHQEYGQDGPCDTCNSATRSENEAVGLHSPSSARLRWQRFLLRIGKLRDFPSVMYYVFFLC